MPEAVGWHVVIEQDSEIKKFIAWAEDFPDKPEVPEYSEEVDNEAYALLYAFYNKRQKSNGNL